MIHSYPKIYNVGHAAIMGPQGLLVGDVTVEEKVDGSQFSFGLINGELKAKSKSNDLILDAPEKMFSHAVQTVKELAPNLHPDWTYRGEYFQKPKHNALAYDRIPNKHIILFDINTGDEQYLTYEQKAEEAARLGLEIVPLIYQGSDLDTNKIKEMIDRTSCLGGAKIEGIVIKNYSRFGRDGKVLMGKHVSEGFKEVHKREWKSDNPSPKDVLTTLMEEYCSIARWQKAALHLEERGQLLHEPKDIANLIKEVQTDIGEECEDEIKEKLYQWARGHIMRRAIRGLPDWYKNKLLESQFEHQTLVDK